MGLFRSADALSIADFSLLAILSCLACWMCFSRSWNRWQNFEELTSLHPDMIAAQVLSIALFPCPPSAPTLILGRPRWRNDINMPTSKPLRGSRLSLNRACPWSESLQMCRQAHSFCNFHLKGLGQWPWGSESSQLWGEPSILTASTRLQ